MTSSSRRFFFVHVHKAAGTSLLVRLRRQFGREPIYPNQSDIDAAARVGALALAPTLLVSHLLERYRMRRDQIEVVAGHFPLRTPELLGDAFTTLTIVRDPVERILSSLRHHRQLTPEDRGRSLEELYEDPVRFEGMLHNHQVKVFSLTPDEIRRGDGVMANVGTFTPTRLGDAKRGLETVDVLGLHDHVEAMCDELSARFGWHLGDDVHLNSTEPVDVPRSLRRRIEDDNAMDAEFYDFARQLWTARRRG